jgi:putative N6-adenine-specific DNA methylase
MPAPTHSLFLAAPPGLEPLLAEEAREAGFPDPEPQPGGVITHGEWPDIWRANLVLRGAGRVLVRLGAFHAVHLAQLDKRARRLDWASVLVPGQPVRVEAACQRSRIYHQGAAAQRIARAISDAVRAPVEPDGPVRVLVRIVEDFCTVSLDTSGEPLHRRGHKPDVGKAPLRETLAALALRACGFRGTETVIDPMCGSGTIALEAAEIAAGLYPGRSRRFAFERLAGFDDDAWAHMRQGAAPIPAPPPVFGFDRDAGAIETARANAIRGGVESIATFATQPISALEPPPGAVPGLVLVNPPYGERIGETGPLHALYATLGRVLQQRFAGWRAGVITSEPGLARATGLPFIQTGPPVPHGKLRIRLYCTGPLR